MAIAGKRAFPFLLELILHLEIQLSRAIGVVVSSGSRSVSQAFHSLTNQFHLLCAKDVLPRENSGVGLGLLPMPQAQSNHCEMVSNVQKLNREQEFLECSTSLSDFKAASLIRALFFVFSSSWFLT